MTLKIMTRISKPDIARATSLRVGCIVLIVFGGRFSASGQDSGWANRAPLPEANSEMAVAELDGKIYVLGGYPSNRISVPTVQVYDPLTDSWELTTPLPRPTNHPMAASVGGKLYFIGGQVTASGSGPFLDDVHEYDPVAETWTERVSMPTMRSSGVAAVIDGKIYVAGGRPPRGNDFAVYDPAEDSWTTLPDLPTARNHLAGAAINGKMYVVGGRFGAGFSSAMTNVLEVYDPETNAWTSAAPMPTVRGGLNAVEANSCLHVWGGESSAGVFGEHEVYNPVSNTWVRLDDVPTPVHGVTGAAYLNGWIHLPGGGTRTGGSSGNTIHQVYRPTMSCLPSAPFDFDTDGLTTTSDVDLLVEQIVLGTNDKAFDLTGDSAVDGEDLAQWLSGAAAHNGFKDAYLLGDSDLDGIVDSTDLNNLARNWRQESALWSGGDFTADGVVGSSDLNDLAVNWQRSIPITAADKPVPEPSSLPMMFVGLMVVWWRIISKPRGGNDTLR